MLHNPNDQHAFVGDSDAKLLKAPFVDFCQIGTRCRAKGSLAMPGAAFGDTMIK